MKNIEVLKNVSDGSRAVQETKTCLANDAIDVAHALKGNIRVNKDTHSVEIYDDYGVKTVLRNLDDDTFNAFDNLYNKEAE